MGSPSPPSLTVLFARLVSGCASRPESLQAPARVSHVDLPRFMGDWYVIANIPTFLEKGVRNAKDSYRLAPDGTILTTFSVNADAADSAHRADHAARGRNDRQLQAQW